MAYRPPSHENAIKNNLHALAMAVLPNSIGRQPANDHFSRQWKFAGDGCEFTNANF
jgi:hypothetical protein